jgi:hypothetical protein
VTRQSDETPQQQLERRLSLTLDAKQYFRRPNNRVWPKRREVRKETFSRERNRPRRRRRRNTLVIPEMIFARLLLLLLLLSAQTHYANQQY